MQVLQNSHKRSIGSMVRQSLTMAWPIASSRLIVAITNFVAMWLVAVQGHDALAAGGLIFPTQVTITVVIAALLFSLSAVVSRAYGANEILKIGAVTQQAWVLSLLLAIPAILLLWFIKPIFISLGQSPALADIAQAYFHGYVWGVIPMFFAITNQQLANGVGKQHLVMFTSFVAAIIGLIAAYCLALGKFGLPHLGVAGVGYAMSLQVWLGFLTLSYYLWRDPFFVQFKLFAWRFGQSWRYLKQLFAIGWPICVQIGGELFSWFVITMLIGWLGEVSLAAKQISGQYSMLVIIPVFGFAQASSVLVGQAAGAKDYQNVSRLGLTNIGIGVAFMLLVMTIFIGIPKLLISFYIDVNNPIYAETVKLAVALFVIAAFNLLFDTMRNITTGALRGLYDSRFPMYLSLIGIWLLDLPLGYALAFHWHFGVIGMSLGNIVGIILAAIILLWRWYTRSHQLMERAERSDAKAMSAP